MGVFILIRLIPGDPAQVMLGEGAAPGQIAAARESMGLDRPLPAQFLIWIGRALRGDFGTSLTSKEPVLGLIVDRFQVTAAIVLISVTLTTLIAVPLGTIAAWKQNRTVDLAIVAGSTLLLSIPAFWLGLLLLLLFGLKLGWVPVVGYVPFQEDAFAALSYIVLPVVTLTLVEIGALARMARSATIDVLRLDYVAHARSKGLSEAAVLRRHVFPNAFAPTLTLIGIIAGHLLGGIAVTETVFTLPGLGRAMVDAIYARDYPVVQGIMLFTATIYVFVNVMIDLLYPLFDPRVSAV